MSAFCYSIVSQALNGASPLLLHPGVTAGTIIFSFAAKQLHLIFAAQIF